MKNVFSIEEYRDIPPENSLRVQIGIVIKSEPGLIKHFLLI